MSCHFLTQFILLFALLSPFPALAQDTGGQEEDLTGRNVAYEAGLHFGRLLPNQINGVTEIMGLGGVYGGFRLGADSFADFSFTTGNGHGAAWKNMSAALRMDMPIEMLVGIAYLGLDATYYQPSGSNTDKLIFGGHAGGGVMSLIGGSTWFRADMKFAVSPGTSLYIGFGILFRFGGGGAGAA